MRDLLPALETQWQKWIRSVCDTLGTIKYDFVIQAFHNTLHTALLKLCEYSLDTRQIWLQLGNCFVGLSHFIADLFVPDRPIDPAAIEKCTFDFREEQRTSVLTEIELHTRMEGQTSGCSSNGTIEFLQTELQTTLKPMLSPFSNIARKDVSRLHSYWAEVDQLMKLVLSPADRKSTRLNSSHSGESRMPSSA